MNWMVFGATGLATAAAGGIAHFAFGANSLLGMSSVLVAVVIFDMQRTMRPDYSGNADS